MSRHGGHSLTIVPQACFRTSPRERKTRLLLPQKLRWRSGSFPMSGTKLASSAELGLTDPSREPALPVQFLLLRTPTDPGPTAALRQDRSEEHTSELQSRFGISYAVF